MLEFRINRRRILCRWLGWFVAANAVVFCLIALNLLFVMPMPSMLPAITTRGEIAAIFFVIFAFIGQFTLLSALAGLPVLILTAIYPRRWLAFSLAVLVMSYLILRW